MRGGRRSEGEGGREMVVMVIYILVCLSIGPSITIHGKFGNLSTSVVLADWCTGV